MRRFGRKLLLVLFLSMVLPSWPVLAASVDQAYGKARKAYYRLLESPRKQKYRDQWKEVEKLFLAAADIDPGHPRSSDALYMAGKTDQGLYGKSLLPADALDAVRHFDRLVQDYPDSSLADDALFLAGSIFRDHLDNPTEAYLRYQRILVDYAAGDMAGKAREKAAALKPSVAPEAKISQTVDGVAVGGHIKSVRHAGYDGRTRVVIDMEGEPRFQPMHLEGDPKAGIPYRVLVDIPAASIDNGIDRSVVVEDGRVRKIRVGQYTPGIARVVLELESPLEFKVFPLTDPSRVILDVASLPVSGDEAPPDPAEPASPDAGDGIALVLDRAPEDRPLKVHVPRADRDRQIKCIVVDAGHGGKDPGAIGPTGVKEKEVTLAMAKTLAKRLQEELKCKVVLTRDSDVYLTLNQRTDIANKVGADLFISLHANANASPRPYGIETYYLNFSKNQKAMEVVARENDTSLKQVGDLELILLDLMANSKINESSRLASKIQDAMVSHLDRHYNRIKNLGVRQGPFYVLLGATMPSVLVETAFISNRREESRLTSRGYQEKTAEAIVKGVRNYLDSFKTLANR